MMEHFKNFDKENLLDLNHQSVHKISKKLLKVSINFSTKIFSPRKKFFDIILVPIFLSYSNQNDLISSIDKILSPNVY